MIESAMFIVGALLVVLSWFVRSKRKPGESMLQALRRMIPFAGGGPGKPPPR